MGKKKKILIPHNRSVDPIGSGFVLSIISVLLVFVLHEPLLVMSKYVLNKYSEIQQFENFKTEASDTNSEPPSLNIRFELDSAIASRPYSVEMHEAAGVMFPEIHFIMLFKETSFCRRVSEGSYSFCSDDINTVLGFYPNNGGGMKLATKRPTTALTSIGKFIKSRGIVLEPKYKRYYNDPHAVYRSPFEYCIDVALWQQYLMKAYNYYPKNELEYISFLKRAGYNPFDHYYNHPKKGLRALYNMYKTGRFQKKYNKYIEDRLGYSIL